MTLGGSQSQQLPGGINFSRLSPVELLGNLLGDKNIYICHGPGREKRALKAGASGGGPGIQGKLRRAGRGGGLAAGASPGERRARAGDPPPPTPPAAPAPGSRPEPCARPRRGERGHGSAPRSGHPRPPRLARAAAESRGSRGQPGKRRLGSSRPRQAAPAARPRAPGCRRAGHSPLPAARAPGFGGWRARGGPSGAGERAGGRGASPEGCGRCPGRAAPSRLCSRALPPPRREPQRLVMKELREACKTP